MYRDIRLIRTSILDGPYNTFDILRTAGFNIVLDIVLLVLDDVLEDLRVIRPILDADPRVILLDDLLDIVFVDVLDFALFDPKREKLQFTYMYAEHSNCRPTQVGHVRIDLSFIGLK